MKSLGQEGEILARTYLEEKGYIHVASNWFCKAGEIDLIMWAPILGDHSRNQILRKIQRTFNVKGHPPAGEATGQRSNVEDQCLVFVEVRLRQPTSFGTGAETIVWQKQQKLIKAAQWYQQEHDYWGNLRFDVVSIESGSPPRIEHIEHAFASS